MLANLLNVLFMLILFFGIAIVILFGVGVIFIMIKEFLKVIKK